MNVLGRREILNHGHKVVPRHVPEVTRIVNVQKLPRLSFRQNLTARPHELQRIPLHRIVTSADHHTPLGVQLLHHQPDARGRGNVQINHLTTRRHETRENRVLNHRPRHAGVSAHDDLSASQVRPERPRKADEEFRRQTLADHAAYPRYPDHQCLHTYRLSVSVTTRPAPLHSVDPFRRPCSEKLDSTPQHLSPPPLIALKTPRHPPYSCR